MNRPSSRTPRALAAAFAAALCTGCLPHVMHGPRIEDDGVSGSLSLTIGRNFEIGEAGTSIVPSLYGGLRRSYVRAEGSGPAVSLGLQVPFLIAPFLEREEGFESLAATSYADIYIQPARAAEPGWEYGGGALFSTELLAPYVQVGQLRANGNGWYTTHMVAFSRELVGDVVYLPTLVFRRSDGGDGRSAGNFSIGAGFSSERDLREAFVLLGVTLELGLGR